MDGGIACVGVWCGAGGWRVVTGGPLAGIITSGKVLEISDDMKKVKLLVSMGGRESAIELDANCVKKF